MQQMLSMVPIIIFFVVYKFSPHFTTYEPIILATFCLVICSIISIIYHKIKKKKQDKMAFCSNIAIVIFGSATVAFHNPNFIKIKITLINAIFGFVLLYNLFHKNPPIQKMFDDKIVMKNQAWRHFSLRLSVMFFIIAIANEVAYRNLSETSWVTFKVLYVPIFSFIYFAFQIRFLMKNNQINK